MTKLRQLLGSTVKASHPLASQAVKGLQYDSRQIGRDELFFAFPGEHVDGHKFVKSALAAGALAVVSEREAPAKLKGQWIQVPHGRRALAQAALKFYGHPDRRLKLTGVTGTNGKTTTVYLIDAILDAAGFKTARLGTIEHKVGERRIRAVNTTPESLDLVRFLDDLDELGGTHATLEASSHALELGRIFGMDFHTAVFTNLSRDHLDFHSTMESYARAKRRLVEGAGGKPPKVMVINNDDPVGQEFLETIAGPKLSFGVQNPSDVMAENVDIRLSGLRFQANTPCGRLEVHSSLSGEFNVGNLLAAIGAAISLDVGLETIASGIAACRGVPGRFQQVDAGQPFVVLVDYAHTDDALRRLVEAARTLLTRSKGRGRVITMFGCGGDRDRTKRPAMGEIAGRLSDRVILTSDNPRSENPLDIINDILVGLRRMDAVHEIEPDRAAAIHLALSHAQSGDIVLLAGKGHEAYQTIGDETVPFDDRETALGMLHELGYGVDSVAR